jgi:hypothetical protein
MPIIEVRLYDKRVAEETVRKIIESLAPSQEEGRKPGHMQRVLHRAARFAADRSEAHGSLAIGARCALDA